MGRQRNDVRRAFVGASSPYVVRKEYEKSIDRTFFQKGPGNRSSPSKKAIVQPSRYKEVLQYKCKPAIHANVTFNQQQRPHPGLENMESICNDGLAGSFTKKDIHSLCEKAKQLVEDNAVKEGFEPHTFFIKSSSKPTPHIVKSYPNGKFLCDSDCLGYKTRMICSHVVAASFTQNKLQQCISQFASGTPPANLTKITCNVNKDAGRKRPRSRRGRAKSPDTMKTVKQGIKTLGELFNDDIMESEDEYSAECTPSKPLKVTLRKKQPAKPQVSPTTSTPYQLIDITGRIRKCAGCGGNLKDGPDPFTQHQLDEKFCIRHKEHDFVWLQSRAQWKQTFDNKHYHIFTNCIRSRNGETFEESSVQISLNHTIVKAEMDFIKSRFTNL